MMSMSTVRTHFWMLAARGHGGVSSPRKYGLKGTIPALVSNRVGSVGINDADGRTVWPRAAKKSTKARLISLACITAPG